VKVRSSETPLSPRGEVGWGEELGPAFEGIVRGGDRVAPFSAVFPAILIVAITSLI